MPPLPTTCWELRFSALHFRASLADEPRGEFGRRPADQATTGPLCTLYPHGLVSARTAAPRRPPNANWQQSFLDGACSDSDSNRSSPVAFESYDRELITASQPCESGSTPSGQAIF